MKSALIIAPPPTPNGGFHVGHFTGPYLAADIFKRYLHKNRQPAVYVISTDDNQSYVDTTARRKGVARGRLIADARAEIAEAISLMSLNIDLFGNQEDDYNEYVSAFFRVLVDEGYLVVKDVDVLYNSETKAYPVESFVSGRCGVCMDSCCGGICESCGHPNNPKDICAIGGHLRVATEKRLVLELGALETEIFQSLEGKLERTPLRKLVDELKQNGLSDFVASYVSENGVDVPHVDLASQKLNVWLEMYVGHLYFLEKQLGRKVNREDDYYQFLGFDNSFFYVVVHEALAILAKKCSLEVPEVKVYYTNQFANLGYRKFSSSKNHAIWMVDIAKECNCDLLRFYLAKIAPEHQEIDFSLSAFRDFEADYSARINKIIAIYNENRYQRESAQSTLVQTENLLSVYWRELNSFSIVEMAKRSAISLDAIEELLTNKEASVFGSIPWLLYNILYLFCPTYTHKLESLWGFQIESNGSEELNRHLLELPTF